MWNLRLGRRRQVITMHERRIFGMILLFTIPVAMLVEHWKYAGLAIWVAVVTGGFCGELWHRWRESTGFWGEKKEKRSGSGEAPLDAAP